MQNTFSIIIPTYNEETNIQRLLTQLTDMDLSSKIIVSDGGSIDNTVNIIQNNFPQIKLVQTTKGRGQQMAIATLHATGNILVFLHADCLLDKSYFRKVEQAVNQGALWGCAKVIFDSPKQIYRTIEYNSYLRTKYLNFCFGDQGIYCTKAFYEKIGGFQPMVFLEDLAFSRAARIFSKPVIVDSNITTSSRLYEKHGVYRTIHRIQVVKTLYMLGVSPEKLLKYYTKE